mgnify:CR=1 FL=1
MVVKVGDAYKYDVLAGFVDLSGYVEKEAGKGLSDENFTAALKDKLDGIEAGANKYVHPTHTAAASGLYKTTVDEEGHVTDTAPVTKDDITKLGIPAKDTTYDEATTAKAGLMSAADKPSWTAWIPPSIRPLRTIRLPMPRCPRCWQRFTASKPLRSHE